MNRQQPDDAGMPATGHLIGPVHPPALHVMSWNIRRRMRHIIPRPADRWDRRAPGLRELLRAERPTLLGAQEALPDQARFVQDSLGPDYQRIGHGRGAGGRGEACPIFYDAERLELLDWQQLALSDHPARAGSTSWGNLLPRILVSATFRDRATSKSFLAINTHLDPLSAHSRLRAARAISDFVSASALPAVLTGDLNDHAASPPLRQLLSDGTLAETWATAQTAVGEEWGTFSNYRAPRLGRSRLDWILASPRFRVDRAAINPSRPEGGWPSDHLPVQAVLILTGSTGNE